MRTELKGMRALVTGASSGIGRALALELAKSGVSLVIAARRQHALESLAQEIDESVGARPQAIVADLAQPGEAARLGQRALAMLGEIDLLINNAGVGMGGAQWVVGDDEDARALFETNYWSPLALAQVLVPGMLARGRGAVVNVSSMGAFVPMPLAGHYSSSKAALQLMSETLRLELRGTGVHVLTVMPGPVETGMLAEVKAVPGGEQALRGMPRGNPETLAKKVVRGLEKQTRNIVYPRQLAIVRHLPSLALRLSGSMLPRVDAREQRKALGGSQGAPLARDARATHRAEPTAH